MDRRSWPWKRKSSEKASGDFESVRASMSNTGIKQGEQEHTKPVSFIQISVEKYEHFIVIEEQVLALNEKLDDMTEKLSSAQADMATKDDIVKQHAKVSEEAISGWEKAEAETLALKQQLESVILLKLTAEEQAVHLDNALKECVKQIRNVKDENERKLHDVVFAKTKLWEKAKSELEATIAGFEQELRKNSADTVAISRSLHERSALLMKIKEEKSQADAEIEDLKTNIQSYEREISSLKYELNVVTKELEIRNEEKNMSMKSAEVANKQHIDDVKKITKLEGECQRLRGLVRKRLPGPAALAQMKLEVERLGHGFGESRGKRQSGEMLSTHPFFSQEANLNEVEHFHKEIEFLTTRLLAMEEETKLLKEALSTRNMELQDSANRCAKTANKLHILEAQILILNQQKISLKSCAEVSFEGSLSHHESNQSLASMSEDGVDDAGSSAESWASALISELSQFKKERISNISKINQTSNQLELMDDFLEMEKLAGLSSENNVVFTVSDDGANKVKNENCDETSSVDVHMDVCKEKTPNLKQNLNFDSVAENLPSEKILSKIQERIASVAESKVLDSETGKLMEQIMTVIADHETSLKHHDNSCRNIEKSMNQDLRSAISWIRDFVILLYKEVTQGRSSDFQVAAEKLDEFSDSVNKFFCNNLNTVDFILSLCHVLSETKELILRTMTTGNNRSTDSIDKITFLENGIVHHDSTEGKLPADYDLSPSNPSSESEAAPHNFSFEEFKNLKMERDNMDLNIITWRETSEHAKLQLALTEQNLAELKLQFSACQKSKDLADTQLRCMTESYKLLETRVEELEAEISMLRSKAETFESELISEKQSHHDDLAKYDSLQEQMRIMRNSEADADTKARHEREIAAAADKLAECQEAIILINKQLNAMHPPVEATNRSSRFREEPRPVNYDSPQPQFSTMENENILMSVIEGVESPLTEYISPFSTSDMESSPGLKPTCSTKRPKHRSRSTSASSLSSILNDKSGRGFSRFFSK
ncbi:filament-like plant protein 4 [Phalaenopsis equestris]|uniref:filament-like plant protein 4 n=1 Tax=Phalaenopsis equestris TaxID=78828 RepID=UPI0009E5C711|nr:filament-like plant protein 4 [Phalaenopsis equestris]